MLIRAQENTWNVVNGFRVSDGDRRQGGNGMNNLTDRIAQLRSLSVSINAEAGKAENKFLLELFNVVEEIAQRISELEIEISELDEYVESIDTDLSDMEEAFFSDDDDLSDLGEEDLEEYSDEIDFDNEELSFECPNCGNSVIIKAAEIDFEKIPTCPKCEKPFFPDIPNITETDLSKGNRDG